MINKFKPKSEFNRNVLTLMTGTTVAQAIPIAISPILTRLYTPEDFGVFALYMSITSIIGVVATGRYELAIMLPEKDDDAINIMALSISITFAISLTMFLLILLFNAEITTFVGNESISNWLYLIPFSIVVSGIYVNLNYFYNRKKQYKLLATNRVLQSGTTNTLNLVMGFQGFKYSGLILGTFMGQITAMIFLLKRIRRMYKVNLQIINTRQIVTLAKKYINFPKFDVLASLASVSSQQSINILFNTLYNSTTAGYYYFTQKIMGLPITFIASAILNVFKEQASKDFNQYGNARMIYISTFKKLFILSIIPAILIYIYSTDLFSFIFGEEWKVAGEYAKILTPMLFLRFISSPLSFMFYIGGKQHLNLYFQVSLLVLILLSFYIADTARSTITYITISFSIFYILQLFMSSKIAGVFHQNDIL